MNSRAGLFHLASGSNLPLLQEFWCGLWGVCCRITLEIFTQTVLGLSQGAGESLLEGIVGSFRGLCGIAPLRGLV